ALPNRQALLTDFRSTVRCGSAARVQAPLFRDLHRGDDGLVPVRDCLRALLDIAEKSVRREEVHYLPLVRQIVETGTLAERIRAALLPHAGNPGALRKATHLVYGQLAESLVANTPWPGRGFV
ncbi:MAG TPA: hypothetical protein VMN39_12665, partial [Longimicrobiaceae bacterium]|nr:hypothetical protein [Longimicrobiaceae bacterium]